MSESKGYGNAPRERSLRQKQSRPSSLSTESPSCGLDAAKPGESLDSKAIQNPEGSNKENDRREVAGSGPDLSTLANESLKTYLQSFAGQIRRDMTAANGTEVMIALVQNQDKFGFRVVDTNTDDSIFIHLDLPADIGSEKHTRLVQEANRLKKAWLLAVAIVGKNRLRISNDAELTLPNYWQLDSKSLKNQIFDLTNVFDAAAKQLLWRWDTRNLEPTSSWLADQYDEWDKAQAATFIVGRVGEVEKQIGPLGPWRNQETPSHAEIVLQGYFGAGFRHL
jgi:hypothetical protein